MRKIIKVIVEGGCVTAVTGVPNGFDVDLIDYDADPEQRRGTFPCEYRRRN